MGILDVAPACCFCAHVVIHRSWEPSIVFHCQDIELHILLSPYIYGLPRGGSHTIYFFFMVALSYCCSCTVGYFHYILIFFHFLLILEPCLTSGHLHYTAPILQHLLEWTVVMFGHLYVTCLPSRCIACVLSMEHCCIPLVLSIRAHFASPHAR
jgi:hypothetical protein